MEHDFHCYRWVIGALLTQGKFNKQQVRKKKLFPTGRLFRLIFQITLQQAFIINAYQGKKCNYILNGKISPLVSRWLQKKYILW